MSNKEGSARSISFASRAVDMSGLWLRSSSSEGRSYKDKERIGDREARGWMSRMSI